MCRIESRIHAQVVSRVTLCFMLHITLMCVHTRAHRRTRTDTHFLGRRADEFLLILCLDYPFERLLIREDVVLIGDLPEICIPRISNLGGGLLSKQVVGLLDK
jgi:hypothetical protein